VSRALFLAAAAAFLAVLPAPSQEPKVLKAGIIGLDTSHVVAFTNSLNKAKEGSELAGVRVVAAYPGGSKDVKISHERVKGFTDTLRDKHGIEIVDSIDDLLKKVDVVLLESVDGRPHLEQLKPCIKAGKPVFIDKPVAASLADAIQIYELSAAAKVPVFSTSAMRFYPGVTAAKTNEKVGTVLGCDTYSPMSPLEHHPDLFFYGIHGVEMLFTLMGPGCETVTRTHTKDADVVAGVWKDGRIGTYRGLRSGKPGSGGIVFGKEGNAVIDPKGSYEPMLVEICKFFKTGKAPVTAEETLEVVAFMEAAEESKRRDGAAVKIADIMKKARDEAARRK